MENPATWGPLERAIYTAWREWQDAHDRGVIGLSLARYIADELRKQGLVRGDL